MRSHPGKHRQGLILLVVLSMLTLFSLLSITYVVYSSHARSASLGIARRDHRGTPAPKLFDEAIRQVVRGTTDTRSALWRQSLLEDLYGGGAGSQDGNLSLFGRTNARDNPARSVTWSSALTLPPAAGSLEAVQILGGSFVKVPLQWNADIPEQSDVWNGRILTLTAGPLAGQSFRVIRYIGEVAPANPDYVLALQYSVTLDLSSVQDLNVRIGTNATTVGALLRNATTAHNLFYSDVNNPYSMVLNPAPLNAYGHGINLDGSVARASAYPRISFLPPGPTGEMPATPYGDIEASLLANYSIVKMSNSTFVPAGDADESYDAPDYANFPIAYRYATQNESKDVIPSYHRPAVINYIYSRIVGAKPLSAFTPIDIFSTIELMQRACGRPLSFSVTIPGSPPTVISQNPNFTGSNPGLYSPVADSSRVPQLEIDFGAWSSSTVEQTKFEAWIRWLMSGPWDVDNDGDGVTDSNWVDLNLPLMTSPEGKLLKALVAFYIEDLGGRLDLNATSDMAHADDANFSNITVDSRFAYGFGAGGGTQIPQGLGYGTGDISLRHLFNNSNDYLRFIAERNGANQYTPNPGLVNFGGGAESSNDMVSMLRERHRLARHDPFGLLGTGGVSSLPVSVRSRSGLGIDLFGNPVVYDSSSILNEIVDEPYEASMRSHHRDLAISIAEWERLYRRNDSDRSALPSRLERLMTPPGTAPATALDRARAVTPVSASMLAMHFGGTYRYTRPNPNFPPPSPVVPETVTRRVNSFVELVEAMGQIRFSPSNFPYFNARAVEQLFPVEFSQNIPLDPNRPFGNGKDDDGDRLIDEADEMSGHGIDDDGDSQIDEADEVAAYLSRHQVSEYAYATNTIDQYTVTPVGALPLFAGGFDPFLEHASRTPYERFTYNGNQGRQLLARHLYCLAQLLLPDDYKFPNTGTALAYGDPTRARILAQWAVNVVDFRDNDSNMTRFAYDADPLRPEGSDWWVPDDGVVWGQEQPELLLTETLAFHDLRITREPSPPPNTNDWQQIRTPQGSLFLELFNPRSGGNNQWMPGVPRGNLYTIFNGRPRLNVSAVTPADNNGNRFPVWRVLLLDPHSAANSVQRQYGNTATRRLMDYQLATQAGLQWSLDNSITAPTVNRVVWFTDLVPTTNNIAMPGASSLTPEKVYRNRSGGQVLVEGGQYLVVGPRVTTYIGQREQSASPPNHRPNPHRIELQPWSDGIPGNGWVQVWTDQNEPGLWRDAAPPDPLPGSEARSTLADLVKNCVTIVAQADRPAAWTTVNTPIGLNISEPTGDAYYLEPTEYLNSSDSGTDSVTGADGFRDLPMDAYVDLGPDPNATTPHDPFDLNPSNTLVRFGWPVVGGQDSHPATETRFDWSTALLQRLANPDFPWHETLNPYITVDWMSIDLTVFNGEETISGGAAPYFASRQKSGMEVTPAMALTPTDAGAAVPPNLDGIEDRAGRSFYSYHNEQSPRGVSTTGTTHTPFYRFRMPLEYIDQPSTTDTPQPRLDVGVAGTKHVGNFITLGYLNSRFGLRGMNGEQTAQAPYAYDYLGSPVYRDASGNAITPAGLFWANRDFVSSYELMNVPLSSAGQFLQDFTSTRGTGHTFRHTLDFEMTVDPPALPARLHALPD